MLFAFKSDCAFSSHIKQISLVSCLVIFCRIFPKTTLFLKRVFLCLGDLSLLRKFCVTLSFKPWFIYLSKNDGFFSHQILCSGSIFLLRYPWFRTNLRTVFLKLTHSFQVHPFSTPWKQKAVRFSDIFKV